MDPTTMTTIADHAILFRQAGDGFYLTGWGGLLLWLFLSCALVGAFCATVIAVRAVR